MESMTSDEGFYEEDEPVEEVLAAFEAGPEGITGPHRGQTHTLTLGGSVVTSTVTTPKTNQLAGIRIQH